MVENEHLIDLKNICKLLHFFWSDFLTFSIKISYQRTHSGRNVCCTIWTITQRICPVLQICFLKSLNCGI